jgi:hypothetical protein
MYTLLWGQREYTRCMYMHFQIPLCCMVAQLDMDDLAGFNACKCHGKKPVATNARGDGETPMDDDLDANYRC